MRDKPSPFYAFRYLISPINKQISLLHSLNKSKEELMKDILEDLIKNGKTDYFDGKKRFIFYGFQKHKDNIFILKFVKEIAGSIYVEGEKDVEEEANIAVKYVYVIVDTEKQIMLIERNVNVFSDVFKCSKRIEFYFRDIMRNFDYAVNIRELTSARKFWSYVNEAEEIYELTLIMNAPNLFHGDQDTRDLLEQIKDSVNNEELEITIKNTEGLLSLTKNTIGQYIRYIQEVGGKYILKFKKDNVKEVKSSTDDTTRTNITRHKSEKYDEQELKNIEDKINQIHNLDSREKAEIEENETQ